MAVVAQEPAFAPIVALGDRRAVLSRQVVRFAVVGVANTALFLGIYLVFRTVLSATVANVLATWLTTLAGTSANGRVTFGVRGPISLRSHVRSMLVTGLGLVITTGAVNLVDTSGTLGEVAVLTLSGGVAGALRFALMRHWVFDRR